MKTENDKDCIKPSKRQLLYQKTQKAAKRYGMIVGVLIYLCLCATLYVWQKRFVTFGLLLITCCFFKSTLLRKVMAICSLALLATIYCIKKSQFGSNIFSFMGLGQSTPTAPKLDDHFVDTAGYCYFALQPDQLDFDELVYYIENEEERFSDAEMTKEFMSNYFDIFDLNQKIGLFVRYEDTDFTIGYDNGIMKFVEKSFSIFEDNILPFKVFDTLRSIDERDCNNKVILCFNLPKNSDDFNEYAKEAIKSAYNGLFYLAKHFFYSVIGSNDGKIFDVYCHKDKTMKTIKIGYESVIEFAFDK